MTPEYLTKLENLSIKGLNSTHYDVTELSILKNLKSLKLEESLLKQDDIEFLITNLPTLKKFVIRGINGPKAKRQEMAQVIRSKLMNEIKSGQRENIAIEFQHHEQYDYIQF